MSDHSSPNVPEKEVSEPSSKSISPALIIGSIFVLALIGAVALFMVFPNFQ